MPDTPVASISVAFAQILGDWLQHERLKSTDIESRLHKFRRNERIPLSEWSRLLQQAQQLRPDAAISLDIGACVRVRHTGVLGYLILNTETLGEALETYLDCEHQFYGARFASLNRAPDGWRVSWPMPDASTDPIVVQVAFAGLYSFMRQRFGETCQLQRVDLPGRPPRDRDAFLRFFGVAPVFQSRRPGLRFAISAVQHPAAIDETGEFARLRQQQQLAFSSVLDAHGKFLEQLQHVMLRLLPSGEVSLGRIAETLHISPRTLQRRLDPHGLSYQKLLDGLREQLATRYLQHSALSLAQLAMLLGYSEQSAFNRAFRQWTGTTPRRVRAGLH